ncbi:MAG TPA: outer membrane beta-barrel protein [Gemmatimonadaceae bacterium]|jgi:hypothetical protein
MKRCIVGVAMGLALMATTVNAQSLVPVSKPVSFGIAGGLSVPTGDYDELLKSGYNLSALLQFQGPLWPVAIRVEGQYQALDVKDEIGDGNTKTIGGLANLLYYIPTQGIVKPYVTGGVGFFHVTGEAEGVDIDPENKFAYDFGAGVEFRLTGMSTFVEANWQSIQTEDVALRTIPIRVGIKF